MGWGLDMVKKDEPPDSTDAAMEMMTSNLSARLQSENPFDHFVKAFQKSFANKARALDSYAPDTAFFSVDDDKGMCLSMHQPWASLVILGFKRFEGREWTSDYRGPLWIHSTSKKPTKVDPPPTLVSATYTQACTW